MAYRRRRRFKNTTKLVKMKFQSFMDISTNADSMQIITISAGGKEILNRLGAFFQAYKYYKIGNISVKLVPASTLPVDPTGLSYESGENVVDPRDQLTPGLMRITNGEDVFEDISGMSSDDQHTLYNSMMLDPRWYKWMLQSGVKRHASPRYWQIGQLHQDKWPGSVINLPHMSGTPATTGVEVFPNDTTALQRYATGSGEGLSSVFQTFYLNNESSKYGFFQTGHKGVLGWLPTDGMWQPITDPGNVVDAKAMIASPPEVEVFKIILPKAYSTRYYYRAFISETVYFREPIVQAAMLYRPLDIFHQMQPPLPILPSVGGGDGAQDYQSGGNYGDY